MTQIQTEILLQQLGGNKFIAMTGAKNLFFDNGTLLMTLSQNEGNVNRLRISLNNNNDTYTMEFFKITINRKTFEAKVSNIKKAEGIYADMLQDIFTKTTGLLTHL